MQRFRGGLVFKAHRHLHYSTLGLREIKKKRKNGQGMHVFGRVSQGERAIARERVCVRGRGGAGGRERESVCVRACEREKDTDRERERDKERERKRERWGLALVEKGNEAILEDLGLPRHQPCPP